MDFCLVWQTEKYKTELAFIINSRDILKPSEEPCNSFAI